MNRLFKLFLLILFISPLFSSAANATVGKVVFAYAPDWNNPTKVVEIERYYDDSTNNWYYDMNDPSKYTFGYVEVPLEGTFSDAIPFIFEITSGQYVHSTTNLVENPKNSKVSSGLVCERTLKNANTLICRTAAYPVKSGYYSATNWAKNKSTSGGFVLDSILPYNNGGSTPYGSYEVVYSSKTSKLTPSTFQSFGGSRTTLTNVAFDTNNPGVVCEYPNCNTFVGSFSVVDSNMNQAGLTEVGYNQTTSCTAGDIIKNTTTIQRPAVYCDYNSDSETDTTPICRIDYTRVSFSAQPFFCSVGGIHLESPSPSEPILVQNPITTNITIITIPSCNKVDVYGLKEISHPQYTNSDNIITTLYTSNNKWYSDSSCTTEITSFEMKMPFRTVLPLTFSATLPETVIANYNETAKYGTDTPFKCTKPEGSGLYVTCNPVTDVRINTNTTLYVQEYLTISEPSAKYLQMTCEMIDDGIGVECWAPPAPGTCNKLSFYGLKNIGSIWEPEYVRSDEPVNYLYSKEGILYKDSDCTVRTLPIGGDQWKISNKSAVPYVYSTTEPELINGILATDVEQTTSVSMNRHVWVSYDGLSSDADAYIAVGYFPDVPDEDVSYYVTDYVYADKNKRLVFEDLGDSVKYKSFIESDDNCYKLDIYGIVNNGTAENPVYNTSDTITTTVYTKNNTFYSDAMCTNSASIILTMPDKRVVPFSYSPTKADSAKGILFTGNSGTLEHNMPWECITQSGKTICGYGNLPSYGAIYEDTKLYVTEYAYTDDSTKEIRASEQPGKGLVYQIDTDCVEMTVNVGNNVKRYISYAPSTQKYYNSNDCSSGTEFTNNKILLNIGASQTKIPVAFSNTSSESVSETTLSSWVPSISTFYCGYDSNNSSTQLVCNFTNPPTQDGLTFYPSAYATLDNRALTIGGTERQRLIAYCNPLSFSGKIFYSKYDDAYALHWYSDDKCTSELTGDFPLQFNLSDTAAAVPIVFYPGTSGGSSSTRENRTIANSGPIYCEYDSAVSSTALKCKYNSSETTFLAGGQLAAPNTTESYYPRLVAGFVDDKHLSVTNDIANATTTVTYTTNICNTINLRYQNDNSLVGLESKTLYWNGETWCKQSGCTDCGYSDKDVLTNSAGYYPAYFSQTSTNKLYQVIGSGANIEKTITEAAGTRFPCSYENDTLSCNSIKGISYTWYVYVFVAPRVTGAITGGNLQNFKTTINGTSIYISGKYYPMMCSDHIKVHFYGINSLGNYGELTARNNYVKYFYETGDWVNANGATSDTFAGLGILSNLTNSATVNGTTYGNGLSAYRAAYIGGAPTSTTPPDNIIITKTTGIVTPEDRPYDLMVTGDSLPKLPQSLFSNNNGSVKDMYYNLLYAANCLDPDGLESGSTCELEIRPNGRAHYRNQCLPGWKDGNFGDDSLTNAAVQSQMLNVTDTCEM